MKERKLIYKMLTYIIMGILDGRYEESTKEQLKSWLKELDKIYKPINQPKEEDTNRLYRLMIYFAHSTMIMYEKDIVSYKEMTAGEFYKKNDELMTRICQEALNIMNYELSDWQIGKACVVYLQSKYYPQSVYETKAYIKK